MRDINKNYIKNYIDTMVRLNTDLLKISRIIIFLPSSFVFFTSDSTMIRFLIFIYALVSWFYQGLKINTASLEKQFILGGINNVYSSILFIVAGILVINDNGVSLKWHYICLIGLLYLFWLFIILFSSYKDVLNNNYIKLKNMKKFPILSTTIASISFLLIGLTRTLDIQLKEKSLAIGSIIIGYIAAIGVEWFLVAYFMKWQIKIEEEEANHNR